MNVGETIDPTILVQFMGSETFYRFGLRGDVFITEGGKICRRHCRGLMAAKRSRDGNASLR